MTLADRIGLEFENEQRAEYACSILAEHSNAPAPMDQEPSFRFESLTLEGVQRLIDGGFIAPDIHYNEAPPLITFLQFVERWPTVEFHGYMKNDVNDGFIRIEGLQCYDYPTIQRKDFKHEAASEFGWADEFACNGSEFRCWWD